MWEREADAAAELGRARRQVRTGVVLDAEGGALEKMLPPFKARRRRPGRRRRAVHAVDPPRRRRRASTSRALDDASWTGAGQRARRPTPVTNKEFSKALGRALHRPGVRARPRLAVKAALRRDGRDRHEGQRAVPERALELGYAFRHPDLDEALPRAGQASARPTGRGGLWRRDGRATAAERAEVLPVGLGLGRPHEPDDQAEDAEQQARGQARLLAVALAARTARRRRSPTAARRSSR